MATGWGGPLLAVLGLWIVVVVACAPLLGSSRIRAAFDGWPTGQVGVNYLVLSGVVVVGHAGTFLAGVVLTGGLGGITVVHWTAAVAVGYPVGVWLLVGPLAMATGRWSSLRRGRGQWFALGIAALWYAVVTVVAAAVVFFLLFVLYFPG